MGLPDDLDHGHIVPLQMRILLGNIVHAETVRDVLGSRPAGEVFYQDNVGRLESDVGKTVES